MPNIKLNKILKQGKALFLAYDQGLEHGPGDFNDKNVNPNYIIQIAKKGKYNAVIFQKGIAEKYNKEIKKNKLNLIVKLNGKTNLVKGEPVSRQLCSVDEAIKLGADAVGYTIYIGSMYENIMLSEFENIEREAHKKGLPVIVWVYPRGKGTRGRKDKELMAYAARTGLEIGADIVKMHYNGKPEDLKWAVKSAGKTKVVIAGGVKENENLLLKQVHEIINSGAIGMAIGRNVWQADKPLELTKNKKGDLGMKLREIFTPNVWNMLLTLILIVGYFMFNSFLIPVCGNVFDCSPGLYHYNSLNFFGEHCGCISFNGFVMDLIIYLFMQFIFPYIVACLILAIRGYGTSKYGKSFKSKKKKDKNR